ncbi:MAG: nitroreductase/quinone reductase family protein [Promethearchaeota archaeon]
MSKSNNIEIKNEELPRPGSVLYNFHYQDEASIIKTLKRWKKLNKYLMVPLYRIRFLQLFGFGRIFLILKTKGWKTGKVRRTPLEYRKFEGIITIFAARGENANWVKNLRASPDDISVICGFRHFKPRIEFISEDNRKKLIMKWYVTKYSKAANVLFGWNPKTDDPESIDFSKLTNLISILLLHKSGK